MGGAGGHGGVAPRIGGGALLVGTTAARALSALLSETPAPGSAGRRQGRAVDRMNLLAWKIARGCAAPAALSLTGVSAAALLGVRGDLRSLLLVVPTVTAGLWAALMITARVFEPVPWRQRLLPCSDAVAKHYRQWLARMFALALVMLPVPLFLWVTNVAPATRGSLLALFKVGTLLMLSVFLLRRDRVLACSDIVTVTGAGRRCWVSIRWWRSAYSPCWCCKSQASACWSTTSAWRPDQPGHPDRTGHRHRVSELPAGSVDHR